MIEFEISFGRQDKPRATDFRRLAEDFRKLAVSGLEPQRGRLLTFDASAQAARAFHRAFTTGTIQGNWDRFSWPQPQDLHYGDNTAIWGQVWPFVADLLSRCALITTLPENPSASHWMTPQEEREARETGICESPPLSDDGWARQARNFAVICDWLADEMEAERPAVSPTGSSAKQYGDTPEAVDLHFFRGWGERLSSMVDAPEYTPDRFDWMVFRPDESARDAMIRFERQFPVSMRTVKDYLDQADQCFRILCERLPADNCPACGSDEDFEDREGVRHCWICGEHTELPAVDLKRIEHSREDFANACHTLARVIGTAAGAIERDSAGSPSPAPKVSEENAAPPDSSGPTWCGAYSANVARVTRRAFAVRSAIGDTETQPDLLPDFLNAARRLMQVEIPEPRNALEQEALGLAADVQDLVCQLLGDDPEKWDAGSVDPVRLRVCRDKVRHYVGNRTSPTAWLGELVSKYAAADGSEPANVHVAMSITPRIPPDVEWSDADLLAFIGLTLRNRRCWASVAGNMDESTAASNWLDGHALVRWWLNKHGWSAEDAEAAEVRRMQREAARFNNSEATLDDKQRIPADDYFRAVSSEHSNGSRTAGRSNGSAAGADRGTLPKYVEAAYQSYQLAESRSEQELTDREAYQLLKEDSPEGYKLPSYQTWSKYVREGRKHHGTQKNSPRAGRTGRSIVRSDDL